MQTGKIDVSTENIFPIIKKFLYSEHEIFLRELVSNAVDATQKLNTLASVGEFKAEKGDTKIRISIDKKKKTLTISDRGIGMTSEEVEKYINQVAFSSAEDFLEKYKNQANAIIGHFGLGFYSAFMVSEKVEILTKSFKEGAKGVKWSCDGNPEYKMEEIEKDDRGTDVILYLDKDSQEFLEEQRVEGILNRYCKFLPIEIAFGKEKEWKDGKEVETDRDNVINDPEPAWTKKPADLKDEDYKNFYRKLYPTTFEEPLFNIHLNVDYPFNLTGILYFPKIKNNIEVQKNKIQLYSNQVFVTDSVEGIVPEFLTLLHGVLDSPDIPLNVSRSYLQGDPNVKKISNHISKKVADRLEEIYKDNRKEYENKWESLKLFIGYGMLTEEKFEDRAKKIYLLKNTDNKHFTLDEYKELIENNQKDRHDTLVYLYATDKDQQYTYIEAAKTKGYDVLLMDGYLDTHLINHLEQKQTGAKFVRVDSDIIDKLIDKEEEKEIQIPEKDRGELRPVFESQLENDKTHYMAVFEGLSELDQPVIITQSEFMRRMKDMSKLGGGGMNFYGEMPDSYNLVINANHPLILKINHEKNEKLGKELESLNQELTPLKEEKEKIEAGQKDKKPEEIPQEEKDKLEELQKKITEFEDKKNVVLKKFGKENKLVKQVVDLALLANNMLKGEALNQFVRRSVELIK